MATAFTHAFVAGALSTRSAQRSGRVRLALTLAVLAVLPDADVIGFRFGIAYGDALGHRGFTHSLVFAGLAGVVATSLVFRDRRPFSSAWWRRVSLLALGTASHGVLDAFTDAGLGVGFLIPIDDSRYFFPWRPLATSPLSVGAFFSGSALLILANEIVWVWLPVSGVLGARWIWRRR